VQPAGFDPLVRAAMASNPPVSLREINASTVRAIVALAVAPEQQRFVANNAVSLAQALFSPEAWYRAIYLADDPVGFLMLYDETLRVPPPEAPEFFLWRFMIDARFQRRGIGKAALEQVIAHVRAKRVATSLGVSYVPGPGCPEPFYLASGFRHTGRIDEGEIVLELALPPESS
jgi:diamine N-acetyltransferase